MLEESLLGKKTEYISSYTPSLLFPYARKLGREINGIPTPLPFKGIDIWNGFEISWLNLKGKPEIAIGEFFFPSSTPNLIESKSFKLYLNSFNQSVFNSFERVQNTIQKDLSQACGGPVEVGLIPPAKFQYQKLKDFSGTLLDILDIEVRDYEVNADLLSSSSIHVEETLISHLLKSNCLATGQPDWASLIIRYSGPKIDHEGLLKYIISYRNHSGFHEHCVELMFWDILQRCRPERLTVYARYTRRGGLDINPFRSNFEGCPLNIRLPRQ